MHPVNIVMVNRRTEELFGYHRDEITGQPIEMLMPQRFREKHPERIRSFFSNPSARPMGSGLELFGCNKAGLEFPVEISLSPIETEDGTLVASSLRDITERKQAEDELKALNANVETQRRTEIALNKLSELLRCEQEMGNLASVIVHELAHYLDLQFVALFVLRNGNTYVREGAYGYPKQGGIDKFESGDGLLGQVVVDATPLKVDKVPEYAQLALGLGSVSPSSLLIYPLVHDETVVGSTGTGLVSGHSMMPNRTGWKRPARVSRSPFAWYSTLSSAIAQKKNWPRPRKRRKKPIKPSQVFWRI